MTVFVRGEVVDTNTRRRKQQELMTELLERKIRLHAQHLYDQRGQQEGLALQDWVQAESTVLESTTLAPLYRKTKAEAQAGEDFTGEANPQFAGAECCA